MIEGFLYFSMFSQRNNHRSGEGGVCIVRIARGAREVRNDAFVHDITSHVTKYSRVAKQVCRGIFS